MIGRRRLEFGGTQGGVELEEPLVNSFFFRTSLACTRGKPGYRTISASFSILPVITILSFKSIYSYLFEAHRCAGCSTLTPLSDVCI